MSQNNQKSYELRRRLGYQGLRQVTVSCQAGLVNATGTSSSPKFPRKRRRRNQKKTFNKRNKRSLNILQLNIDGMSVKSCKKEQLAKTLKEHDVKVALIQESQHKAINPHITGYTNYSCNCNNCQGVITYIRNDVTGDVELQLQPNDPTHVQKVTIWDDNKKFTIYNVYSPPSTTCRIPDLQESVYRNTIVAGDFNAHSPLWGYEHTNNSGKFAEELNQTTNLVLQQDNTTTPTLLHKVSSSLSRPDLTFVSSDLDATCTVLAGIGSDHKPILINLPKPESQPQQQKLRWNFQKARWKDYNKSTEESFKSFNLDLEKDPDSLEKKFSTTILEASKKNIPRGFQKKYKPFWTSEVEVAVSKRQQARLTLEETPNLTNKIAYNKATAKAQQTILEAKRKKWQTTVSNIDLRRNGREAWTLVNNLSGNKRKSNPKPMPDGETSQKKANLLNNHFYRTNKSRNDKENDETLLQELKNHEKKPASTSNPLFEDPFTKAELDHAIRKLKNKKSPGPDKIHNEMLKNLGPNGRKVLLHLINLTWEEGVIPKSWRNAHIVPIHKEGKDPKEPKSYRPISLTSCEGKVAERMVNRRLYWWLEDQGLLPEEQAGYRAASRTEDQLFRMIQSIQDGFQEGISTTAVFVDFQQAYDRVWKKGLLLKMQRLGIKGKIYDWVKNFLTERTIQTKVENSMSERKVQEEGLPQGSALSCTLFLIFLNDLPQELKCQKAMYADDLALWKTHRYTIQAARHLNRDLRILQEYCKKWKITINPTKTVYSTFTLSPVESKLNLDIKVEGMQARKEQQPTYLGVQMDTRLTFREHIDNLKRKASKRLTLIKRLASSDWGSNMSTLRSLYIGYVRSVLDCNMSLQISCSKTRQADLDKVQNNALRLICGGMKSTPIAASEITTNIEPLGMRREKATIETFERCKRFDKKHPARKLVDNWVPKNRIKNKSILHHVDMLKEKVPLPINRAKLKKTSLAPPNLQPSPPEIKTELKEKAMKKSDLMDLKRAAEKTILSYPEEWTHIYTDGSAEEGTRNAGWGVWIKEPDGKTKELFGACGDNSTNYDAEISAMQHALDDLQEKFEENRGKATDAVLFTDSMSALQAMESGDLNDALTKVLQSVEKLQSKYPIRLTLQWIPGHTGIQGNEKADMLAKKGSQTTQPQNPTTLQAVKQKIKQAYRKEWMDNWTNGSTARKVFKYMNKVVPKDCIKQLKRKDQTTVFRLRTQHIPLNVHLNRINPEKPPHCVLCNHPYETVEHVLFECREVEDLRLLYLPNLPDIENTLYCSKEQLESTALFYDMTCVRRANAQRLLD